MIENPLAGLAGIVLAWLVGAQDPIQLAQDYGSGIPMVNQQPAAAAGAATFCDTHGSGSLGCYDFEGADCTASEDNMSTTRCSFVADTAAKCNNTTHASAFSTFSSDAGSEQMVGDNTWTGTCFDTYSTGLCTQFMVACPVQDYVSGDQMWRLYDTNIEVAMESEIDGSDNYDLDWPGHTQSNVAIDPGDVVTVRRMWIEFDGTEQITDWWIQSTSGGNAVKYGSWPQSTGATTLSAFRFIGVGCWFDALLIEDLSDCCSSSNPPDEDGAGACT